MRVLPIITAVVLFGSTAAHAQSSMTTPGMGATSPLGILGPSMSTGSNSGTGIPLGATEIDPGGLSPAPVSNCSMTGSGMTSMPITSSSFDGGGLGSTAASTCASTSGATSSTGTASLSTMETNSSFTLNGGTIPLGSTEINSTGVSPLITVPMQ